MQRLIKTTLITFIVASSSLTNAADVDSLLAIIKKPTSPINHIDALNDLAKTYQDSSYQYSTQLATEAYHRAIQHQYEFGIFTATNTLGINYDYTGQPDSSIYYYQIALRYATNLEDYHQAIVKNNVGIYYITKGNYPLALKYFQEALDINNEPDPHMDPTITYSNIGLIHEELKDTVRAIEYYEKSAETALLYDDKGYQAFADMCLGYIHYLKKEFNQALSFYKKCWLYYEANEEYGKLAETYYYAALCFLELKQYNQAITFHKSGLEIYQSQGSTHDVASMYACIAEVYHRAGNEQKALEFFLQSKQLAEEINAPFDKEKAYKNLATLYANQGDHKTAYQYFKAFHEIHEAILSEKSRERVLDVEYEFALEQKEAAFKKLAQAQEKSELKLKQQSYVAGFLFFIALLIGWISILLYRANNRNKVLNQLLENKVEIRNNELAFTNKQLERSVDLYRQSNEELEGFTYAMSHDLKEPLRNISTYTTLLQRKLANAKDPDLHDFMDFILAGSKKMYSVLEDMLIYAKLNKTKDNQIEMVNPNELLSELQSSIRVKLEEKNATILYNKLPTICGQKTPLFLVFKNTIENGIKYNRSSKPTIKVSHYSENGHDVFSIEDNGIGIPPQYHQQVFQMFKRLHDRTEFQGSGIGLAVCQKIIKRHGGNMWVKSQTGKGSTFYFSIPKN